MAKLVKVVKETTVTYKVETTPGQTTTDEQAIDIVKKRIEAGAPLDIIDKEEKVKKFTVSDA
jgi:hypothetical protein